jgi:hypothetical protein
MQPIKSQWENIATLFAETLLFAFSGKDGELACSSRGSVEWGSKRESVS